MRIIIFTLALIIAAPSMSMAQNALSYTTKGARSSANDNSGNMRSKAVMNDMSPAKPAESTQIKGDEAPEDPIKRVWRKYKALAAGEPESEQTENTDAPKKPKRPKATLQDKYEKKAAHQVKTIKSDPKPSSETPPPTGFAAILQQYHKSKEERRGMRSITVNTPKALQKPTPPDIAEPASIAK